MIGGILGLAVLFVVGGWVAVGSNSKANKPVDTHVQGVATDKAEKAPSVSLAKLEGGKVALTEYRGEKPVIVDFWASWCPNCRRDMPVLNRLYKKYKGKVEVVAINLQESETTVKDFVDSQGFEFIIALDPAGVASRDFGVRYTNTHVLIDKQGNIVRVVPGDISESDFTSLL